MYRLNRRNAMKGLFCVGAAATSFGLKSAAASEVGNYLASPELAAAPVRKPKVFNALELFVGDPLKYLPRAKILRQVSKSFQKVSNPKVRAWRQMVEAARKESGVEQLRLVNDHMNAYPYISDKKNFGVSDRWLLPDEFFNTGGDCEDYAIAKFASLRELGFHPDRLRIVLADDTKLNQHHAFLAVYLGGKVYILDNQIKKLVTHESIRHYTPICSFNENHLWVHWQKGKGKKPGLAMRERMGTLGSS